MAIIPTIAVLCTSHFYIELVIHDPQNVIFDTVDNLIISIQPRLTFLENVLNKCGEQTVQEKHFFLFLIHCVASVAESH